MLIVTDEKLNQQKKSEKKTRSLRGMRSYESGRKAENYVREKLSGLGWHILLERARTPCGEIDLVVSKENLLCFIEVKHRKTGEEALYSLRETQKKRLYNAAEYLLSVNPGWNYECIRFDLITIDREQSCLWIKDILR